MTQLFLLVGYLTVFFPISRYYEKISVDVKGIPEAIGIRRLNRLFSHPGK